jgi:hypothetical protein
MQGNARVRTELEGLAMLSNVSAAGAAPVDLNGPGHYLHWGVVQLSVANLVVIGIMVAVFVLAVVLPFPKGRGRK